MFVSNVILRQTVRNETGISLVEVAIAILVLSIGVIGLASLQITAKRTGFEAVQRTEATSLATGIFERMRANSTVLDAYVTAGIGKTVRNLPAMPAPNCINGTSCTASQMDAWDLWEWERAVNGETTSNSAGGLVRPTACISVDATEERIVIVEIAWEGFQELVNDSAGTGCGTGSYDSAGGVTDGNRQLLRLVSYLGEG
jgi:type IV pilus assembly protein PilV